MNRFLLYLFVYIIVLFSMDSININGIFKKNKNFQAKVFYFLISLIITYLLVSMLLDISSIIKIV